MLPGTNRDLKNIKRAYQTLEARPLSDLGSSPNKYSAGESRGVLGQILSSF